MAFLAVDLKSSSSLKCKYFTYLFSKRRDRERKEVKKQSELLFLVHFPVPTIAKPGRGCKLEKEHSTQLSPVATRNPTTYAITVAAPGQHYQEAKIRSQAWNHTREPNQYSSWHLNHQNKHLSYVYIY